MLVDLIKCIYHSVIVYAVSCALSNIKVLLFERQSGYKMLCLPQHTERHMVCIPKSYIRSCFSN